MAMQVSADWYSNSALMIRAGTIAQNLGMGGLSLGDTLRYHDVFYDVLATELRNYPDPGCVREFLREFYGRGDLFTDGPKLAELMEGLLRLGDELYRPTESYGPDDPGIVKIDGEIRKEFRLPESDEIVIENSLFMAHLRGGEQWDAIKLERREPTYRPPIRDMRHVAPRRINRTANSEWPAIRDAAESFAWHSAAEALSPYIGKGSRNIQPHTAESTACIVAGDAAVALVFELRDRPLNGHAKLMEARKVLGVEPGSFTGKTETDELQENRSYFWVPPTQEELDLSDPLDVLR